MVVPSLAQQSSIATKWKERWQWCVELWVPNARTEALWKAVAKGEGRNWGTSTRCHISKVKLTMWSELNQELQGGIHSSCESNYFHWILSDQQINQNKIFMRGSSMVSDLIWLFFKNICRAMFPTYKEKKQTPENSSSFCIQKWEPAFHAEELAPSLPIVILTVTLPFLVDSWWPSAVNTHWFSHHPFILASTNIASSGTTSGMCSIYMQTVQLCTAVRYSARTVLTVLTFWEYLSNLN